jgi:trehalose-6-phosphate synthase
MRSVEVEPVRLKAADLEPILRHALPARRLVVASNREPYEHYWDDASEAVQVRRPAGGLVAALDPLMQAVGGVWVAWGSGDRDRETVGPADRVPVPPEAATYQLRRLWLDQQDINQYYYGYANQFLWPLCHLRPALARTRAKYWERYGAVNERFASAVVEESVGGPAAVWFHDYHLALAPQMVRAQNRGITLAHFWHIPFPPLEIFRVASQAPQLLRGLLANDVMGFHLPLFGDNFLRCTESLIPEARVDWAARAVDIDGRRCNVRSFPISIDIDEFRNAAQQKDAQGRIERLRARYGGSDLILGVGVDRIDYSKGLEEKIKALDILFDCYPELRERFTFVQIGVPSRTGIDTYDWLNEKLERAVWAINDKWSAGGWQPVHLFRESLSRERLALYYRAADICMVNSLQDGMNLVAKEFIACQVDDPGGVLVLSKFAGAAEELDGAYEVNPYDPEETAHRLREAIALTPQQRRERTLRMKRSLRSIYDWMGEIFTVWGAAAQGEAVPLADADRWSRVR